MPKYSWAAIIVACAMGAACDAEKKKFEVMTNKSDYYELDEKRNPTCAITLGLSESENRLFILNMVGEFAKKHDMQEGPAAFFPDGRALPPLYSNDAFVLSTFIMDMVPDKSQHYIQIRLDCVKKSYPFTDFEKMGEELLETFRAKLGDHIESEQRPVVGDG